MLGSRGFGLASLAALAALLLFLVMPLLAIFVEAGPGELWASLGREGSLEALSLSLRTSLFALALIVIVGTPAAYLLARRRFRGRAALITLIELPLVLPPAAAGIALLAAVGPEGLAGGAIAAFEALDPDLLDASRTLGAGDGRTFALIAVPGARAGLASGMALAWGRALGEFGATLIFAGSLQGRTQTAPLAIFEFLSSDSNASLALSGVLVVLSAVILLGVKLLGGQPEAARA